MQDDFFLSDDDFKTFMWEKVVFEFIDIKEAIFIQIAIMKAFCIHFFVIWLSNDLNLRWIM